jgi:hypothetical protein
MPATHNPNEPWYCPRCQREKATEAEWLEHIKNNHPDLLIQIQADEEPVRP